jgi:hypothetical protein
MDFSVELLYCFYNVLAVEWSGEKAESQCLLRLSLKSHTIISVSYGKGYSRVWIAWDKSQWGLSWILTTMYPYSPLHMWLKYTLLVKPSKFFLLLYLVLIWWTNRKDSKVTFLCMRYLGLNSGPCTCYASALPYLSNASSPPPRQSQSYILLEKVNHSISFSQPLFLLFL